MADLPDLDKNQISFIAYWNATDHGADSIAPDEALSAGSIQEYTLYDNGWEGSYSTSTGRDCTVRAKSDGWLIAYLDRSETYGQSTDVNPQGPYDLLNDWTYDENAPASIENSTLERAINDMQAELSNSGSISYNSSNVGLYDYRSPSASTVTNLYTEKIIGSLSSGVSYTSDTDIYSWVATATADGNDFTINVSFNGQTFLQLSGETGGRGSLDVLGEDLVPNSGEEYILDIDANDYWASAAGVLVVWG